MHSTSPTPTRTDGDRHMVQNKTGRRPRTAIVTMVYNERANLPVWQRHYRRAVPDGELFVVDHGSDDDSTAALHGVSRIPLPRRSMDEMPRTRFMRLLQASLLQYYDIVIYTDCDELIVVDPDVSATLGDYVASTDYQYASPIGLNVQHMIDEEPALHDGAPMLSQRRYCFFRSNMCKPLISRVRLQWEPGFHSCDRPLHIDRNLYLFHIKCIDRDRALARQRVLQHVRWTQKAIDAQHGAHHRFDDALFLRQFFLDPKNRLRRDGLGSFAFDDDIALLTSQNPPQAFNGRIVEIPERFKNVF